MMWLEVKKNEYKDGKDWEIQIFPVIEGLCSFPGSYSLMCILGVVSGDHEAEVNEGCLLYHMFFSNSERYWYYPQV